MTTAREIDFYYCCSCPWTYLAFVRIREVAMRTGATVRYLPILVDRVHAEANRSFPGTRLDPNPRKAAYSAKDLQDWARYCGVRIHLPPRWPVTPERAQRGAIVASAAGQGPDYAHAVFRAYFTEGRDILAEDVIDDIAVAVGLDRARFRSAVAAADTAAALQDNCDTLVARGGFGSPTFSSVPTCTSAMTVCR